MLLPGKSASQDQVLDDAMIAVKEAARMGDVLLVNTEAEQILRRHPDCRMSLLQIQDAIAWMGVQAHVCMRLG